MYDGMCMSSGHEQCMSMWHNGFLLIKVVYSATSKIKVYVHRCLPLDPDPRARLPTRGRVWCSRFTRLSFPPVYR